MTASRIVIAAFVGFTAVAGFGQTPPPAGAADPNSQAQQLVTLVCHPDWTGAHSRSSSQTELFWFTRQTEVIPVRRFPHTPPAFAAFEQAPATIGIMCAQQIMPSGVSLIKCQVFS